MGALAHVAKLREVALPKDAAIDAEVDLGAGADGFVIQARLRVTLPGIDLETARALVNAAHAACPYSKASSVTRASIQSSTPWLKTYYFTRASVSIAWIVAAVAIGKNVPAISAILPVAYPAWDAVANYVDAQKNGGLKGNFSQTLNFLISIGTGIGVAVALGSSMNAVIDVFGAWAILSGLMQLATAIRRWKSAGAQWAMALSGARSAARRRPAH